MTDTTLSLAARLAANLIVDAIKLAKPGARLAGKIGDRLLGGSPFDEREAQRFLTMGGSERLAEAEAERDVYEPDPLWSAARVRELGDEIPNGPEYRIGAFGDPKADIHLCKTWDGGGCHCSAAPRLFADDPAFGLTPPHNTMPNWPQSREPDPKPPGYWLNAFENTVKDHADFLAPQSSAPVAPKPTDVAGSPGSASTPPLSGVDPGHLNQPVGAGVAEPGTGEAVICGDKTESAGVGHHCACYLPLGHDSWHRCSECTTRWTDGATALRLEIATVCEVLAAHEAFDYAGKVECPHRSDSEVCDDWKSWRQHVAPLIVAALKAPK